MIETLRPPVTHPPELFFVTFQGFISVIKADVHVAVARSQEAGT